MTSNFDVRIYFTLFICIHCAKELFLNIPKVIHMLVLSGGRYSLRFFCLRIIDEFRWSCISIGVFKKVISNSNAERTDLVVITFPVLMWLTYRVSSPFIPACEKISPQDMYINPARIFYFQPSYYRVSYKLEMMCER